MKTLRDLLDLPLPQLGELLTTFLNSANESLTESKCCGKCPKSAEETTEEEAEDTEPKVAADLAIVLEFCKAVAEKYQATESEGLLDHLVDQLAKERNLDMEKEDEDTTNKLMDEIKAALEISPEKRELLKLDEIDRIEFVISKVMSNTELVNKALDGNKESLEELESKATALSYGVVDENDLRFGLRSTLRSEYAKRK